MSEVVLPTSQLFPNAVLPAGFEIDVFLVSEGIRALGKIEEVSDRKLDRVCGQLEDQGLHTRAVAGPARGESDIFFARTRKPLENVHTLERQQRLKRNAARRSKAAKSLGALLGYPQCCIDAFVANSKQNDEEKLLSFSRPLTHSLDARLNFFPRAFAPTGFVPCSSDCQPSLKRADKILKKLQKRIGLNPEQVVQALTGVIAWSSGPHFLFFREISDLSDEGFSFGQIFASHELVDLPKTSRHQKAVKKLQALKETLSGGDRLTLTESGALVYSGDHELCTWEQPDLRKYLLHFQRMED